MQVRSWVLLLMSLLSVAAQAQEGELLSGAKTEGRVVWYSGSNLGMAQAVSKAFEKKYPFMKVDLIRSSDERMLNRITTEKQAGKILFDVVNSQLLPMMYRLNVVIPYRAPGVEAIDAKYKDPGGYWVGLHINYFALGYNSKMVSREQAPRDWADLGDPKWKGKIGMDPEEYDWLGGMMEYLGEEKVRKLLSTVAQQEIHWHKGHTQVAQLMAAGEFPLALTYAHRIEDMKKLGAPLDWVRTTKPIVANVSKVALSVAPPHSHGARLLVNFLISKEGQTEVYKNGNTPVYPGIVPKDSPLDPTHLVIHPVAPKITLDLNRYAREFDQIFGPRR